MNGNLEYNKSWNYIPMLSGKCSKNNLKNTELMSTFTMSIGNTIVGALQLIIAVAIFRYNKNVS